MYYDTQSLAQGVSQGLDLAAKTYANGQIADKIVKVNPEMLELLGMSKEEFGGMSAQDKTQTIMGAITGMGLRRQEMVAKAQEEEQGWRREDRQRSIDEHNATLDREAENDRALMEALRQYGVPAAPAGPSMPVIPLNPASSPGRGALMRPTPEAIQSVMPSPRDRLNRALQTPGLTGKGGVKLLESLKNMQLLSGEGSAAPAIPAGFVPKSMTVGANGKPSISYGPKDETPADGKALTAEELKRLSALDQSERDLDMLEKLYGELPPDWAGPVSGRIKNLLPNANISAIQNAINSATPNLARGVFGEVGVLTDADVERYTKMLPSPYDTDAIRQQKMAQLRTRLKQGREETLKNFKSAGRSVSGFKSDSKTAEQRFDNEADARAAGAKAGDIIQLRDPSTGNYRRAKLL